MFGRKQTLILAQAPRTEFVDRDVAIVEKRAPTDESVRLLQEMQEKARAAIAQTIRLEGNELKAVVQIECRPYDQETVAIAHFEMNGARMKAEGSVPNLDPQPQDLAEALAKAISDEIARVIVRMNLAAFMLPGTRRL